MSGSLEKTIPYLKMFTIFKFSRQQFHKSNLLGGFPNYCFGYLIQGNACFETRETAYHVGEGEIIYIPKGAKYVSSWRGTPRIEFYSLQYSFLALFANFKMQVIKPAPHIRKLFDELYRTFREEERYSMSLSLFYNLYDQLAGVMGSANPHSYAKQIEPAIDYLERNCNNPFSVAQLAKMCNLSESHFYSVFKKSTGYTPVEYKSLIRSEQVVHYLINTDYSVEHISQLLHFSSPAYMRIVLRKYYGKTPKEIRNMSNGLMSVL